MPAEHHDAYMTNQEVQKLLGLSWKSVRKVARVNGIRTRQYPGLKGAKFYRPDVERLLANADGGDEVRTATRS